MMVMVWLSTALGPGVIHILGGMRGGGGGGGLPPHRERLHLAALDKVLAVAREPHCSSFEASNGKPCSYKRLVLSCFYHGKLQLGGKLRSYGWVAPTGWPLIGNALWEVGVSQGLSM